MLLYVLFSIIFICLVLSIIANKKTTKYLLVVLNVVSLLLVYWLLKNNAEKVIFASYSTIKNEIFSFFKNKEATYFINQKHNNNLEFILSENNPIEILLPQENSIFLLNVKLVKDENTDKLIFSHNELTKKGYGYGKVEYIFSEPFIAIGQYYFDHEDLCKTLIMIRNQEEKDSYYLSIINDNITPETVQLMNKDNELLFSNDKKIFLLKLKINL